MLFLGTSQVVYGISSQRLYQDYGISAYSLGMSNQPVLASYSWLKEADRSQDFKVAFFDVGLMFEEPNESYFRKAYDNMKLSWVKLEGIARRSRNPKADSFASYLFPIEKYHVRWPELRKRDFQIDYTDSGVYRGNGFAVTVGSNANPDNILIDDDETGKLNHHISQTYRNYLINMKKYCDKHDISLVLTKIPKSSWSLDKHNEIQEIADEYDIPFLDFTLTENFEAAGFDFTTDFMDREHLNLRGADKLTDYLAEYLQENWDFEDCRTGSEEEKAYFDEYTNHHDCAMLFMEYQLPEYLDLLKKEQYDVIVTVSNDVSQFFPYDPAAKSALEEMGLQVAWNSPVQNGYVAVIRGGEVLSQQDNLTDPYTLEGTFAAGTPYVVNLDATTHAETFRIGEPEEEEDIPFRGSGINFIVYDNVRHEMVEYVVSNYNGEKGSFYVYHNLKQIRKGFVNTAL